MANIDAVDDNQSLKNFDTANFILYIIGMLCFLIICSLAALGVDEYPAQGFSDKTYHTEDRTLFNQDYAQLYGAPSISTKTIDTNAVLQAPLFYDFDEDGINEIVTSQNSNIIIFQNNSLDFKQSFAVNNTIYRYQAYTYSGDRYLLALSYVGSAYAVYEYKYNSGTGNFDYVTHHRFGNTASPSYAFPFACDEQTGRCLTVGTNINTVDNSFFLGDGVGIQNFSTPPTTAGCQARDSEITVNDIDNDGINEFIYTQWVPVAPYKLLAEVVEINSTGNLNYQETQLFSGLPSGVTGSCSGMAQYFTSPLIANVLPYSAEDNLVIAKASSSTSFKIYSFEYVGNQFVSYQDHPEVFTAEGKIISNPFTCKIFNDYSGINDYCVLGYTDKNATDLLAASDKTSELIKTREFKTENFTNYFVPSSSTNTHIVHAIQADDALQDSTDYSEILTPFGIYQPYYQGCSLLNFLTGIPCELRRIYPITYTGGIASLGYADKSNVPFIDLVYTTATNIYYIDDKQVNQNAIIDEYTVNPCVSSVWKQTNSTAQMTIKPRDRENDPIEAQAILYYGDANEQDSGLSGFSSSGTDIPFSFIVNKSISSGKILLRAHDNQTEHNDTFDEILLSFSVAADGVILGDCTTSVTGLYDTAQAAAIASQGNQTGTIYTNSDNALTDSIKEIASLSHLPLTIIFLFFLVIYNGLLIGGGYKIFSQQHAFLLFLVLLFSNLIAAILAGIMGIIGIGLLVTIIVLILITAGFYLGYILNKSQGG